MVNVVGLDGERVKNGFEWRKTEKILRARGISYERERDLPSLMAVARGEKLTVKIEVEIAPKVELDDLESEIIRVFVRKDPVKSESESSSYGMSM